MNKKESSKAWRKTQKWKEAKHRENESLKRRRPHAQRLRHIRRRCKAKNLSFNLDEDYIKSIETVTCPVFGTTLIYSESLTSANPDGAQLDRIVPNLGYIKGNVKFILFYLHEMK